MNRLKMAFGAMVGAAALSLTCAPAMAATTVYPVGSPNFFLTSGTPTSPSITAVFFKGFSKTGVFDDTFEFTIPQNGVGSGSISTSFSGNRTKVTITDLLINGVSYVALGSSGGQSFTLAGIPIISGVKNTIQVIGKVSGSGSYAGTATFQATVVPEIATWGMMLGGIGLIGGALRRRQTATSFA